MKEIRLCVIPHNRHRLENTAGDYFQLAPGHWTVLASDMKGDCRLSCILLAHEFLEMLCTQAHNISERRITAWDKRMTRINPDLEPGEQKGCPYRREHRFAEKVERMLAKEMGVRWSDYTKALDALWQPQPRKPARPARNR